MILNQSWVRGFIWALIKVMCRWMYTRPNMSLFWLVSHLEKGGLLGSGVINSRCMTCRCMVFGRVTVAIVLSIYVNSYIPWLGKQNASHEALAWLDLNKLVKSCVDQGYLLAVTPSSNVGQYIHYVHNEWNLIFNYSTHAKIRISNWWSLGSIISGALYNQLPLKWQGTGNLMH